MKSNIDFSKYIFTYEREIDRVIDLYYDVLDREKRYDSLDRKSRMTAQGFQN